MSPIRNVLSLRGRMFAAASSLALAVLLALGVLSTPALVHAAAAGPVLETGISGSVHAGETIELKWNGVDSEVDELEIQLSVDGGRRFALRVSPELDARAGRYLWRVPNLATADAHLRIRYNRRGREILSGMSAAFRITPNVDVAPEFAQIHEGAWWSGARDAEAPAAARAFASSEAVLISGGLGLASGVQTRGLSLPALVPAPAIGFSISDRAARSGSSRETSAPRIIARRN